MQDCIHQPDRGPILPRIIGILNAVFKEGAFGLAVEISGARNPTLVIGNTHMVGQSVYMADIQNGRLLELRIQLLGAQICDIGYLD